MPSELGDTQELLFVITRAIRQLQERARTQPVEVVSMTATYSMVDIDSLILMDATDGDRTVFLLTAAGREGRLAEVKKTDSSANTVKIDPTGSETIDGSSSIVLTQKNAMRAMRSDGTNWRLVGAIGNSEAL
tara:strand:+ start:794 stop:1189 length:396 start_codon:yes stop_codon:yes gene_type:complete